MEIRKWCVVKSRSDNSSTTVLTLNLARRLASRSLQKMVRWLGAWGCTRPSRTVWEDTCRSCAASGLLDALDPPSRAVRPLSHPLPFILPPPPPEIKPYSSLPRYCPKSTFPPDSRPQSKWCRSIEEMNPKEDFNKHSRLLLGSHSITEPRRGGSRIEDSDSGAAAISTPSQIAVKGGIIMPRVQRPKASFPVIKRAESKSDNRTGEKR